MYTCRECERPINQASEVCPYCGVDVTTEAIEPGEPVAKPTLMRVLLRWTLILLPILAGLWSFLWFILPEQREDVVERAEKNARTAVSELRLELESYAAARGSFPQSLEELGEGARGPARKAMGEGYQLRYTPGAPNADGALLTFTLVARPGNYGYTAFYLDETGVLRSTRENRGATSQDPPVQ